MENIQPHTNDDNCPRCAAVVQLRRDMLDLLNAFPVPLDDADKMNALFGAVVSGFRSMLDDLADPTYTGAGKLAAALINDLIDRLKTAALDTFGEPDANELAAARSGAAQTIANLLHKMQAATEEPTDRHGKKIGFMAPASKLTH